VPASVVASGPDPALRAAILGLADAIEAEDGAPPLSDQTLGHLSSRTVTHLIARDDTERVIGYAQLDGRSLEVAAEPPAVDALVDAAAQTSPGELLVWSHGRRSRLVAVLTDRGFERVRELHQLRRPLDDSAPLPPDPALPDNVVVRPFVPGADDAAWLELNAAAFAGHREQAKWTVDDLRARLAEPWFDASGFLLAERGDELLGFHWTKVHPDGAGEVYVLGVSPAAQGLGLGNALLIRGLRLLAERGCHEVLLYVDGDNPGAMRLYERAGFVRFDLDVQWQQA
jgi:mycothiol synthase